MLCEIECSRFFAHQSVLWAVHSHTYLIWTDYPVICVLQTAINSYDLICSYWIPTENRLIQYDVKECSTLNEIQTNKQMEMRSEFDFCLILFTLPTKKNHRTFESKSKRKKTMNLANKIIWRIWTQITIEFSPLCILIEV